MDIVKYDPFKEIEKTLEGLLNQPDTNGGADAYAKPFVDIHETKKEVIVTADIPGVDKKDVRVSITKDGIAIAAEQKNEFTEEKNGSVWNESVYTKFYEAFSLPSTVDYRKAKTTFNKGVLEVVLPKTKSGGKK